MSRESELEFEESSRRKIIKGVNKLARAVSITLGPKGKNVAIVYDGQKPHLTKDGVTVANSVNLKDPFENLGCQIVKEAAQRSADVAGDGTTTSTVLAASLLEEGNRLLETGYDPRQVVKGIESACEDVTEYLSQSRVDLETTDQVVSVATISANGESLVGDIVAEAICKVGPDGPITVENAKGFETHLDFVEGTVIDRGYLSPYFATDKAKGLAELEKVYVLLYNQSITTAKSILPFLEFAASSGRSILVVANDVSNEALQALILNKVKGTISVCAIKAPEFGNARTQSLEDLAEVTGGKVLSGESESDENSDPLSYLGFAEKVMVDKHGTLLMGTKGNREDVARRIDHLTEELSSPALQESEASLLNRRIRRLSDGIAIIRVGGSTEGEMFERRDRVDDALCAARAAKRSGIQPGGGTALLQASKLASRKKQKTDDESFDAGYQALLRSCCTPVTQITTNAGEVPEIVVRKLHKSKKQNFGYDAATATYGDMIDMKIIDPHDVVVSSLVHATSVACSILTIGCAISVTDNMKGEGLGLLEEL